MKTIFIITAILNLSLVATAYFCVIIGAINKDVDFTFMSALTTLFSIFPTAMMLALCNDFKETDKVIAELKEQVHDYAQGLYVMQARAEKEARHDKYKRCLAMAEWCNSGMVVETFACFRPRSTKEVWREEHKYWAKWRKIWFELAMKFKVFCPKCKKMETFNSKEAK